MRILVIKQIIITDCRFKCLPRWLWLVRRHANIDRSRKSDYRGNNDSLMKDIWIISFIWLLISREIFKKQHVEKLQRTTNFRSWHQISFSRMSQPTFTDSTPTAKSSILFLSTLQGDSVSFKLPTATFHYLSKMDPITSFSYRLLSVDLVWREWSTTSLSFPTHSQNIHSRMFFFPNERRSETSQRTENHIPHLHLHLHHTQTTQQASQEGLSLLLIFSHIVYINHDRTIKYYIQIIV